MAMEQQLASCRVLYTWNNTAWPGARVYSTDRAIAGKLPSIVHMKRKMPAANMLVHMEQQLESSVRGLLGVNVQWSPWVWLSFSALMIHPPTK